MKIPDVECGTGAAALLVLPHGLEMAGTDASEAMVARTKKRALATIVGGDGTTTAYRSQFFDAALDSAVAEGQDLPSKWPDSFDLAVANFSVIFFPQPVLGLREIFRCLVPGTASLTA